MRESADDLSWIGVTICGRTLNNLRYVDDIVLIATSAAALQQLIDKVDVVSREYGLEISAKKTKVMTTVNDVLNITCNGVRLEQVESFRYLGVMITKNGDCTTEIRTRLGIARTAIQSLSSLWKDRTLSQGLRMRLIKTLVWPIASYGCESWTMKAADKKRVTAFEMTAYRRMLKISWTEHRTNASILEELNPNVRLLTEVMRRKLKYFGHIVRAENLSTSILHGRVNGVRRRGRPRRRWSDDIKDWMRLSIAECIRRARDRLEWRRLVSLSLASDPQQ
jgi:hypothetical protein